MTIGLMSIGILPIGPGVPLLAGGAAAATMAFLAISGSNRLQRGINGWIARALGNLPSRRQRSLMRVLAWLEGERSVEKLLEELPWIVSRAAGVAPVTLFLVQGARFVPVRSTSLMVRPQPLLEDDPLVGMLRRSDAVHYLYGRSDDLQNAAIHAVNGEQLEACVAVSAIPLRRGGRLIGFLLCGGLSGTHELDLGSMGALECVARCCAEKLAALTLEPSTIRPEPAENDATSRLAMPVVIERRLGTATAVCDRGDYNFERYAADRGAEPQMAGSRGGYETND